MPGANALVHGVGCRQWGRGVGGVHAHARGCLCMCVRAHLRAWVGDRPHVGVTARRARGCLRQLGQAPRGKGWWCCGAPPPPLTPPQEGRGLAAVPCAQLHLPGRWASRAARSPYSCPWSPTRPRTVPAWRRTRPASPGRASTATCRVSGGSNWHTPGGSWRAEPPQPPVLTLVPLLAAAGACPRLTPPPSVAPDVPLGLPPHGLWSRHILQQTLMDEGLRLARLVSHERVGRLSPCLPGKPPGPGEPLGAVGRGSWGAQGRGAAGVGWRELSPPFLWYPDSRPLPAEFEDGLAERGPPPPPEPPRGTIKVEQETSRQ